MRRFHLLFVAAAFVISAASGFAQTPSQASESGPVDQTVLQESPPAAPSDAADELAWDQLDNPSADPGSVNAESPPDSVAALLDAENTPSGIEAEQLSQAADQSSAAAAPESSDGIVLGPQGIDDLGRVGRLHTVSSGDTLWDLAAAYLGTAWVWPSVWIDNDDIDNPHLIMPGDKIWITANEMRVVTDAEAESFLTPVALEVDTTPAADEGDGMQVAEVIEPVAAMETGQEDPSTLDAFPVGLVPESEILDSGRQITVSERAAMGFVSPDDLAGASSIVASPVEREFLAAGDPVVLGMGEGDVEVGDEFTIFQVIEEIRDVETNRIVGHHVEILGWFEVKELTGDTSIGEIRMSYDMITRGARVMPRVALSNHVTMRSTPDAIEGKVIFLPSERAEMDSGGYVFLNRGEFHGVEVGSALEVFDPGKIVNDRARRVDVRTPDHPVAQLIVVTVMSESSVAYVMSSTRELEVGDDVRPRVARLAQR